MLILTFLLLLIYVLIFHIHSATVKGNSFVGLSSGVDLMGL